jgi:hypothetical protein
MSSAKPPTDSSARPSTRPAAGARRAPRARRAPAAGRGEQREEHEGEHRHDVLDHHPAHREAPLGGVEAPALLERAQEHHRARHAERQPEHHAAEPRAAPEHVGERGAERGREGELQQRARRGQAAGGEQVVDGEVQPHADAAGGRPLQPVLGAVAGAYALAGLGHRRATGRAQSSAAVTLRG